MNKDYMVLLHFFKLKKKQNHKILVSIDFIDVFIPGSKLNYPSY